MWDNIREQLGNGNYKCARLLLNEEKAHIYDYDDTFAVLEASICEVEGNLEEMFCAIAKGLSCNPFNCELYYMLGRFYCTANPNQAMLCFENALLYSDSPEDRDTILFEMENLRQSFDITVRNTVIVIVSYNSQYLMEKNIQSIRSTLLEGTYKIIVVDNASDDGVAEWLEGQKDITLIRNKENKGFPCACNQGVVSTLGTENENSDIFLLNNDTRLAANSLFWLRMGLYENKKIGVTGSYSNYAGNNQQLNITFTLPGEYLEYGAKMNIPLNPPYEERNRQELLKMISNDWMDCGYVKVKDKYGDYGIAGFYCLNLHERKLEHFLFSCRILGMGVEQYVYSKIGYPDISIATPVASTLDKKKSPPWISESKTKNSAEYSLQDNRVKILLKGPCDLSAIESYLTGGKITTEFNYVNTDGIIVAGQNHSMHIWESANCSEKDIMDTLNQAPFLSHGDFETLLFQKEYHVICYSLLPDCHAGLHRNKKQNCMPVLAVQILT